MAVVPVHGYRPKTNHSLAAIKWLKWLAHKEGLNIQHALNGGEVKLGRYYVDGQNRNDRKQVYEFLG